MLEETKMNYTSAKTGVTYTLRFTPETRTEYAEFMNADSAYTKHYTHTDIYVGDKWVWFCSDDNVPEAIDRLEQPAPAHMNSRFD